MPLPKNPHVAFAWLWINDTPVTVDDETNKPRHLEAFSCNFSVETLGYFEFTLFDPEYDFIESLISQGDATCQIQFGYAGGTGEMSNKYDGEILEYTPEFLYDGIRIQLKGMFTGVDLQKKEQTRTWSDKRPHEIAEIIADNYGYTLVTEKTEQDKFREDLDATGFVDKKHHQDGITDWQFLLKMLKQCARDEDGGGGYMLYFDYDNKELHMHPPNNKHNEKIRTYKWRTKDTEILEFSPQYNGKLVARFLIGSSTQVPAVDAESGAKSENLHSKNVGEGKATATDSSSVATSNPESETPFQAGQSVVAEHPRGEFADREAKHHYFRAAMAAFASGTLTIVGDPTVQPMKKYEVLVDKKDGGQHWMSGVYLGIGVTHNISGGSYTTTIDLMRSGGKDDESENERTT